MMLGHLGHADAARAVERAIETVPADPTAFVPDMGGSATTRPLGAGITAAVERRITPAARAGARSGQRRLSVGGWCGVD